MWATSSFVFSLLKLTRDVRTLGLEVNVELCSLSQGLDACSRVYMLPGVRARLCDVPVPGLGPSFIICLWAQGLTESTRCVIIKNSWAVALKPISSDLNTLFANRSIQRAATCLVQKDTKQTSMWAALTGLALPNFSLKFCIIFSVCAIHIYPSMFWGV